MRQISDESDKLNMPPPQQTTLPNPKSTPVKLPNRYNSEQRSARVVHRAASFGPAKPSKTYQQVGRQYSFQVPNRPGKVVQFNPATPIAVNANMRGSMTPMAPPSLSMAPSLKGMTYSLDRRQEVAHPRSQKDSALYQNISCKLFRYFLNNSL